MPRYNKQEDFELGLEHVAPFFESLGFSLARDKPYVDKEGKSYSARFSRHSRSVELNHLYSLGPVIYHIREFSVEHTFYIQALGATAAAQFPSFSDDSISGYPALLHDLQTIMSPFFIGAEENFITIACRYMHEQRHQQEVDSRDLQYHASGEYHLKNRVRELFTKGRYDEVIRLESEIKFPELLTKSERQIFVLARKRLGGN